MRNYSSQAGDSCQWGGRRFKSDAELDDEWLGSDVPEDVKVLAKLDFTESVDMLAKLVWACPGARALGCSLSSASLQVAPTEGALSV